MYMKITIELDNKNLDSFFKKVRWYNFLSGFGKKFVVEYNGKQYDHNTKTSPKELETILNVITILNANSKREKYNLLYDYACDYLDNEFICKKLCDFKDDMCIRNRCRTRGVKVSSCCERNKTRVICKNFDAVNKCCKIRSIGCKLYTCHYLKKRGIRYRVNSIPYLKYFLSIRQKAICISSIFIDKKVTIDKLMKFYKLP